MLIINPGSTSTKIAIYKDDENIFEFNISHSVKDLSVFNRVSDQVEYRLNTILTSLEEANISTEELLCVSARGGLVRPIPGGTYVINEKMCDELLKLPKEHASNLGALVGKRIMEKEGISGYIVDPVVVDEMMPLARITGLKGKDRFSIGHILNQKAIARKTAEKIDKKYDESNLIICHMGGGVTVGIHSNGNIIDINNGLDGDGPMSPERAGNIPNCNLIDLIFEKKMTKEEVFKQLVGNGGFVSHLGTNDAREVEKMIADGNEEAKLVYEAMAYQVAKEISALSAAVNGEIDAISLTGGLAYSKMMTDWINERVKFIAPVHIFAGEGEIEALYLGAMRVIRGEEEAKEY